MSLRRVRRLRAGDRVAVVAPASPFPRDEFEAGLEELRSLGLAPAVGDAVYDIDGYYECGPPESRAHALSAALADPSIGGIFCARGGYGSAKLLPALDAALVRQAAKPVVGYSDLTSLLTFLTCQCGITAFHGPTVAGRLSLGPRGYDRQTLEAALGSAVPMGELRPASLEVLKRGEARGPIYGGTLSQIVASLGTPFAFTPPEGYVLLAEDVNERPYRLDRMLTQLRLAGLLGRASAVVFGEMPGCDEPGGSPTARAVLARLVADFPGPVLFGFPTGHTAGPMLTVPLGVDVRVVASTDPALVVEEAAVRDE